MQGGSPAVSYAISQPYTYALPLLRTQLQRHQLEIVLDWNVGGQLHQQFGVSLSRCHVFVVNCPVLLLQATVMGSQTLSLLPLRVVVSEQISYTLLTFPDYRSAPDVFQRALLERFADLLRDCGAHPIASLATA